MQQLSSRGRDIGGQEGEISVDATTEGGSGSGGLEAQGQHGKDDSRREGQGRKPEPSA